MDFGRIENIDDIDISLPADHPSTINILQKHKTEKQPQVFVGLPITSHKDWVGTLYPAKPKNDLLHYAQQFNALEANSTGYMAPGAATINKWINDTPGSFKFCPKIPQNISRSGNLMNTLPATEAFCDSMRMLGNRLGICFLQLSDNFGIKRITDLAKYLEAFRKDVPLAVEFRHKEWFENKAAFDEIFSVMEQNNISSVITDSVGRRDAVHQRLTTPHAFIRFNGYGKLHQTDFTRLDAWAQRLKIWMDNGLQSVYFFVHTDEKQLNPFLSNYIIQQLNKNIGLQLAECTFLDKDKLMASAHI